MVFVKLAILVFISLIGVDLDLCRPFYELLVLYFCEYLGNGSIQGWQYQFKSTRWHARTFVISLSSISI